MMISDLLKTLEQLRSKTYPDLDAQLVRDIVGAQADFMDNQTESYKRINKLVTEFLSEGNNNADIQ